MVISHVALQLVPDKRRYVLASLSLQCRFRRLMHPAGLADFPPARMGDDSREAKCTVPEGTRARHKGTSEDH